VRKTRLEKKAAKSGHQIFPTATVELWDTPTRSFGTQHCLESLLPLIDHEPGTITTRREVASKEGEGEVEVVEEVGLVEQDEEDPIAKHYPSRIVMLSWRTFKMDLV